MKRIIWIIVIATVSGCVHNSSQTWEDMKTAGRYMHRGVHAMFGKEYDSRLITSDEEFTGPYEEEYISLRDADLHSVYAGADTPLAQPKAAPGEKGVPSLSAFFSPSELLRAYFKSIHFATDEHTIKDKRELDFLVQMAEFLKKNPTMYLLIEGHCDERGSASYNMALGMRRANCIRSILVKQGIDLNRIYTVSRGKEQPIAFGHSEEEWRQNRRSDFKIYER